MVWGCYSQDSFSQVVCFIFYCKMVLFMIFGALRGGVFPGGVILEVALTFCNLIILWRFCPSLC